MPSIEELVRDALSANRMGTYEQAKGVTKAGLTLPLPLDRALELYAWNAQISAAFMHPLHLCEVVIRNGVADTIEMVYGTAWPWSVGFLQSLPNPASGYNMHRDLLSARNGMHTTGKVIPELSFAFWERMFTGRNDRRLWNPHLLQCFPNFPASLPVADCRHQMFNALKQIRLLRNRIAHHEPIFSRNLVSDFQTIYNVIAFRSHDAANWMNGHQQVSTLLASCPI